MVEVLRESAQCRLLLFTHCPSSALSIHCLLGVGLWPQGASSESEDARLSIQTASKARAGGSVSSWKSQCLMI